MSPTETPKQYVLPASLIGHADLGHLLREVEAVEVVLQSQKVRGAGAAPGLSQLLNDFVTQNDIDIANGQTLMELKERLRAIKDHAPVVHMAFATDVDPYLLQQIVSWLREQAHPHTLLTIGLQPYLIGGVYLRTPNKVHDFSVKTLLKGKRDIIVKELERLRAR